MPIPEEGIPDLTAFFGECKTCISDNSYIRCMQAEQSRRQPAPQRWHGKDLLHAFLTVISRTGHAACSIMTAYLCRRPCARVRNIVGAVQNVQQAGQMHLFMELQL